METNYYNCNHSTSEFYERHKNDKNAIDNKPCQKPIEWHSWNDLYDFFYGYFCYFGDDISTLDNDVFERMVKTIWRMAYVNGVAQGKKDAEENRLSFKDHLKNWINDIQRSNAEIDDESCKIDRIGPFELWDMLMNLE